MLRVTHFLLVNILLCNYYPLENTLHHIYLYVMCKLKIFLKILIIKNKVNNKK